MARPRLKPQFTEEDLGKNPLVTNGDYFVRTRKITQETKYVELDSLKPIATAITYNKDSITTHKETFAIEKDEFTKLYSKAAYRIHIAALPLKARDLCFWLLYELEAGKDYIWINKRRYMEECDVSTNTTEEAIKELIKASIIIPTVVKGVYWINPRFFFKGSRIEKYKDYLTED